MGIIGGVENLQWLFTATFVAMFAAIPLFGWITSRYSRATFLPYVYYFFVFCILLFYILFQGQVEHIYLARAFFVWVSVFNLFVVSVFWSFMSDVYTSDQAKRVYALIAAGGTSGVLTGSSITTFLAVPFGLNNLLLISAGFLSLTLLCMNRINRWQSKSGTISETKIAGKTLPIDQPLGGNIWAGVGLTLRSPYLAGIALLMILFTTLATFLYFQQAEIIRDSFSSSGERARVFGAMDLATNSLTLLFQIFITSRIIKKFGLALTLALIPVLLGFGFLILSTAPVLSVIVVVQVLRRAGNYAVMRPAREALYVVLSREEKYKAKNFIDTVVYRGGDAVAGWFFAGLRALGLSLSSIALIAVPLAGVWAWVSYRLGREQQRRARDRGGA